MSWYSLIFLIFFLNQVYSQIFHDPVQVISTEAQDAFKDFSYQAIEANAWEPLRHVEAIRIGRTQPKLNFPFPCKNARQYRSLQPPRSVHRLMPGDVDVVAAMGDSLTAGMGGSGFTLLGSLVEDRGYAWSIGGQGTWRNVLTLPNILREFNPALYGYSAGTSTSVNREAVFNVAEPGALSRQMPYQAKVLVNRIWKDKNVDFYKHWKVVTLMIGNNDVCSDMCYLRDTRSVVETHRHALRKTLDYLKNNLPRTLVNVVPISQLALLTEVKLPEICFVPHRVFCPCLFGPRFEMNKALHKQITKQIQDVTKEVVESGDYYNSDNFTVVLQPFTTQLKLPMVRDENGEVELDTSSFLAPDCFHFSQGGYARAANALWNNMMEPEGQKQVDWEPLLTKFKCPTRKHPYIYTKRNSPHKAERSAKTVHRRPTVEKSV